MALQDRLDEKKREFRKQAPGMVLEIMDRAARDLVGSGIMEGAVREGDQAPDFTLRDTEGGSVRLGDLVGPGPVVLGFYRGRW